jgi:hypothetical protein
VLWALNDSQSVEFARETNEGTDGWRMKSIRNGGGWKAIGYSLKLSRKVGWLRMWKALRSKNTCKTCAVGMGGQLGGMVNEGGYFPEVCKKSFQAMASDMQDAVPANFSAALQPAP